MKRLFFYFIAISIVFVFITDCQNRKTDVEIKSFPFKSFSIKRGTNLGCWLSQSELRGAERAAFITEKDIRFIDSTGFDHIRLPIDEEQMWDEKGKRHEDAFILLQNCLEWCRKDGLRVVVDLHILRSHDFNAKDRPLWTVPAEQDKFIALWKDLSGFLHGWPNAMVAYEFMNEPVADDAEQWNRLISRVTDSIRHWEPVRVLVIGSNRWQSADTFDKLKVPAKDTNIILSFHFYEPFTLTHYQASWTDLKDFKGDVNYPGQIVLNSDKPEHMRVYNRDTLVKMMQKPLHLADSLKLKLYCGEFGVIDNAPRAAKLKWYDDMVSIFNEKGVAYTNWNYKEKIFGIFDKDMKPDLPLIKILTNSNGK
jgi:endoglucanase